MTALPSSEMWAHCEAGHDWLVCKLPMPMEAAGRQMKRNSTCPECGGRGYMGKAKSDG